MTLTSNHWETNSAWLFFAAVAHVSLIALFLALQTASSAAHTDIMAVTLLPMAPPAPSVAPAPPQPQPVKTTAPKKRLSEPAAISQPSAPADSAPAPAEAQVAKSSAQTDSAPLFVAAHDAAYLNNPRPIYPSMSRRLGEQGKVMLEVHVQPDGSASKVSLAKSSGFPRLDEAAVDAVKRWRFVPAKQGNDNVAQVVIIPMPFVLEK